MTINEMKKYLETLVEDGYGENQMRIMVTDSYGHSNYGVEATFSDWSTTHNSSVPWTSFYFSLNDSDTGEHYDRSKNAKTSPLITFRK